MNREEFEEVLRSLQFRVRRLEQQVDFLKTELAETQHQTNEAISHIIHILRDMQR